MTFCHGVALVQVALAIGSLALGQPALAGAFAVFAAVQIITLAVRRCSWGGQACETTYLVDPAARTSAPVRSPR